MSFFGRLFSLESQNDKFEKITAHLALPEDKDPWCYESLARRNLDRSQFSYERLTKLCCWPDQLLQFIQINRLAYIDIMHLHNKYATLFDEPLRSFITWLRVGKINNEKLKALKEDFFKNEDTSIPDRYWVSVLHEDNCYMYQLEEASATRSPNEDKHYKLFKLAKLASVERLYEDPNISVYVALYDLRGGHARVDDYFRRCLHYFLDNSEFMPDIETIPFELPKELDEYIELCSETDDHDIINRLAFFRNILRYLSYQILSFKQVFVNRNVDVYEDFLAINMNQIKEATYTYKYFWERIENKDVQDELLLISSTVDTIINIKRIQQRKRLQTPSYTVHTKGKRPELRLDPAVAKETRKRSRSFGYIGRSEVTRPNNLRLSETKK